MAIKDEVNEMSMKLRVGGLSQTTDETGLRNAFSRFGEVIEAEIVRDRQTERSRGFGFVTMAGGAANTAMCALDGTTLDGRSIRIEQAIDHADDDRRY